MIIGSSVCSNIHAKNILLISHSEFSRDIHPFGIGEIAHSQKMLSLFHEMGFQKSKRLDLYEIFENFSEDFEPAALMNVSLAEQNQEMVEGMVHYESVLKTLEREIPDILLVLTWCYGIGALASTGIFQKYPTITKLYAFHEKEQVFPALYASSDLIVTESLLGNLKGIDYGIPAGKMVYLPHHFSLETEGVKKDDAILHAIAAKNGKIFERKEKTVVIGISSRLELRKNCGFAIEAVRTLVKKGYDCVLVLKGNFPAPPIQMPVEMEKLLEESWFFWDREPTCFPEILTLYACWDICLQLSGCEGASNTVVECLALGKPVLVLNGTTNPYLFRGGACFVKTAGMDLSNSLPYCIPDQKDLISVLERFVDSASLREEWGEKGKKFAYQRFHPSRCKERLPLIAEAALTFRSNDMSLEKEIESLFKKDCEEYEL